MSIKRPLLRIVGQRGEGTSCDRRPYKKMIFLNPVERGGVTAKNGQVITIAEGL